MATHILGPGRHTRAQRAAADALPNVWNHGSKPPSRGPLLWLVVARGRVVGFATGELVGDTLHFRGCYVLPKFRGGGLQSRLLRSRLRYAKRRGVRTVRTYVASDNIPSLVNVIRAGFQPARVVDGFLELERSV